MKKLLLLLSFALAGTHALYAQRTIGEVYSSDASVRGSVLVSGSGTQVLSGSQVTAGEGAALLKLERGGELRICPKTNLSLSSDSSGKSLVLGMNSGAMELNYSLESSTDSLVTPDFRLQLISPGQFHLAISVAPTGDTCLHSLAGNDAAVFVAEMMGNESYQLSPGKSVLFREGKISGATAAPATCGCPETVAPPRPATKAEPVIPPPEAPPLQPLPAEAHMEVKGEFVYRGSEAVQDYYTSVAKLSVSTDNSRLAMALVPQVSPPQVKTATAEKKEKPGLLHRMGNFFGRLFGK